MQWKWIVSIVVLLLTFGCSENPITTQYNEKHGYSLSTYFNGDFSDSSLHININFNGIQHIFPKISINGQQIDTGYYPDYFVHQIKNFSGNSFKYSIENDNDRIEDSVVIPSRIDSIYCNGKLLKDTSTVEIDRSSSYIFSWGKTKCSILYSFQLWSGISKDIYQRSSDASVTVLPNRTLPEFGTAYGTIYLCGISYPDITYQSKPNVESKKQYIYYDRIQGPYREVTFEIH